MKNILEKHFDALNIYVTLKVRATRSAKLLLIAFLLIVMFFLILIGKVFNINEFGKALFFMSIFGAVFILFPLKYLIWNIYGKEGLIINKKNITYYYDYGFIQTNVKTIPFNKLGYQIEYVKDFQEIEIGELIFYNYREIDDLPQEIYRTTILIDLKEIQMLVENIDELFYENEFIFSNN